MLYHLGRHFNDLDQQKHERQLLQHDWIKYGRQAFTFRVGDRGDIWNSKKRRLEREKQRLLTCQNNFYNTVSKKSSSLRKQITLDGVIYSSGAEAARVLGISPSTMYRFLKTKVGTPVPKAPVSGKEMETTPLQLEGTTKILLGSKPVSINGQEFPSRTKAMSVLGIAKSTLYRRLRSSKYPTWFYIEKTRSNDYPERE